MQELLDRIVYALDKVESINAQHEKTTQQYQNLKNDLTDVITKALQERPVIKNSLDAQSFAKHVLPQLIQGIPNDAELQKAANELKTAGQEVVNQIQQAVKQLPTSIPIKGDFYGFSGWKPLIVYSSLLLFCGALCTYFWYEKQETVQYKQNLELLKERNYLNNQIEAYRSKYPKYAEGLFPPYDNGGFWNQFGQQITPPQQGAEQ